MDLYNKVKIEVCINCDAKQSITESVSSAFISKASSVELCSSMEFDGLTPSVSQIIEARNAFKNRKGLMVMIRPRKGDFCYSNQEFQLMKSQIRSAALHKADGVVFGVLRKDDTIAENQLNELVELSIELNLVTTFHRAFDVTPNFRDSLDVLIKVGVDRVLTSGTRWQERQPAVEGIETLKEIIYHSDNRIEIVIGGGINKHNVAMILGSMPSLDSRVSFHAYSGVKQNGLVTEYAVEELVKAAQYELNYTIGNRKK